MRRHPTATIREQRAMTQARTVGRRHHAAVEDARDLEPAPATDARRCRVVRWFSPVHCEVISKTTVDEGIALAAKMQARCVVVLENGKPVFDNRQDY